MAAAGMGTMGKRCCCCKDIWPGYAFYQMKTATPATFKWTGSATGTQAGLGDFDHVNRKALIGVEGSGNSVDFYLHDEQADTETFVINRTFSTTEGAGAVISVVDPDGERIVTCSTQAIDGSHDEIVFHKLNYDGTGDTELFTLPVWESPDLYSNVTHMHYNRITQTVFAWVHRGSDYDGGIIRRAGDFVEFQNYFEIIEFDLLGNNPPAVVVSIPGRRFNPSNWYTGQLFVLEIDYTNQKLWWEITLPTTDGASTITRYIQSSDWDGANIATHFTITTPATRFHIGWQYSHKDDCFYLSTNSVSSQAADTINGLWRVEPDWSGQELLYSRAEMIATPAYFRLGCGYETLGPDSLA